MAYKNKIGLLNNKVSLLMATNNKKDAIIISKDLQFKNQKKIYRRKTFFNYLKGGAVGGSIVIILIKLVL